MRALVVLLFAMVAGPSLSTAEILDTGECWAADDPSQPSVRFCIWRGTGTEFSAEYEIRESSTAGTGIFCFGPAQIVIRPGVLRLKPGQMNCSRGLRLPSGDWLECDWGGADFDARDGLHCVSDKAIFGQTEFFLKYFPFGSL